MEDSSITDNFAAAIERELFGGRLPLNADAPKLIAEVMVRFYVDDDRPEIRELITRELTTALTYRLSARLAFEGAIFVS